MVYNVLRKPVRAAALNSPKYLPDIRGVTFTSRRMRLFFLNIALANAPEESFAPPERSTVSLEWVENGLAMLSSMSKYSGKAPTLGGHIRNIKGYLPGIISIINQKLVRSKSSTRDEAKCCKCAVNLVCASISANLKCVL